MKSFNTGIAVSLALLAARCGPDIAVEGGHRHVIALRPDNPAAEMWRYGSDDVIEFHDSASGTIRVHFTRDGDHAVLPEDSDTNGTPDFVEGVATLYEEALAHYVDTLGFRAPIPDTQVADNGGDASFDVYLLDFAGSSDGVFTLDGCLVEHPSQCVGYVVQENDFVGYGYPSPIHATRVVGSHELFHAIQAAYDRDQGGAFNEGTAVWATEAFDPTLDDLEHLTRDYLENPDAALDRGLGYGQGLFFLFLAERYDPGLIRVLLEATVDGANSVADPYWLDIIDDVLRTEQSSTFPEAFVEFATWNLYTSALADPESAYKNGADYAALSTTRVSAPYRDELRRFYASTEYFAILVNGRTSMTAALADTDDANLQDLHLILAVESSSGYREVVTTGPSDAASVDTEGALRLVVGVVNTAVEEVIRRPGFCVGTPDEVADCVEALVPSTQTQAPKESKDDDGGCRAARSSPWVAGLLLLALVQRRK